MSKKGEEPTIDNGQEGLDIAEPRLNRDELGGIQGQLEARLRFETLVADYP